jgi:hypothetical protein
MRSLLLATLLLPVSAAYAADDYSTLETVRYVVGCMAENGGNTEENLYACTCRFDHIAAAMPFKEYEQAQLYERYRDMPGKRGGLFRNSEAGDKLKAKLAKVRKEADQQCPLVKHIEAPRHETQN